MTGHHIENRHEIEGMMIETEVVIAAGQETTMTTMTITMIEIEVEVGVGPGMIMTTMMIGRQDEIWIEIEVAAAVGIITTTDRQPDHPIRI